MAASMKMEFAVRMTCDNCVKAISSALSGISGIESYDISLERELVTLVSSLPYSNIQKILESTGRQAILLGIGNKNQDVAVTCSAAVAIVTGSNEEKGVVRFIQISDDLCVIDGTVDGLREGSHVLCIHEYGDLRDDGAECGEVFGSDSESVEQRYGYLGKANVTNNGRAEFRFENSRIKLYEIIGRSLVVHHTGTSELITPESERVSCGIIARSSGLFENSKRICACSGKTIWEERLDAS